MHRFTLAALAAAAFAFTAMAADPPKPADPAPATTTAAPVKGVLPKSWRKLGVSEDVKKKAYTSSADAKTKIAALEAQITAIKEQEHKDLNALLTEEQRKHLAELLSGEATGKSK